MIPLALMSYLVIIGIKIVFMSFYLRRLERNIRAALPGNTSPAWAEIETNTSRLSRGTSLTQPLTILLVLAALAVFGGFTFVIFLSVGYSWKWAMVGLYGTMIAVLIRLTWRVTQHGRRNYLELEKSAQDNLGATDAALSNDNNNPRQLRLLLFHLVPRPNIDFTNKGIFIVFGAVLALTLPSNVEKVQTFQAIDWAPAICVIVLFEIVLYQGRYLLNDLRGHENDLKHPDRSFRRRLAFYYRDLVTARKVALTNVIFRLMIYCVTIQFLEPKLRWLMCIVAVALILCACAYDSLRELTPTTHGRKWALAWNIHLLVGTGYAIRGALGLSLAAVVFGIELSISEYLFVLLFFWSFGIMFVSLSWTLDAVGSVDEEITASGCRPRPDETRVEQSLWTKPQLAVHLEFLGLTPETTQRFDHGDSSPLPRGHRSRFLDAGDWFSVLRLAPLVLATVVSAIWPVMVSGASAALVVASGVVGVVGALVMGTGRRLVREMASFCTTLLVAVFVFVGNSTDGQALIATLISLLPLGVLILTNAIMRRQSRYTLIEKIRDDLILINDNYLRPLGRSLTRFFLGRSFLRVGSR